MDKEGQNEQHKERGKDEERLAIGLVAAALVGCLLWLFWHGVTLFSLDRSEKGIR
jgi:hypothetical protein